MKKIRQLALAALLVLLTVPSFGQVVEWLTMSPAPLSLDASSTASLLLTFSEPVDAASLRSRAIRVMGSLTGSRMGSYTGAGTTQVRFTPVHPWLPGERIEITVTQALRGVSGTAARPRKEYFVVATTPASLVYSAPIVSAYSTPGIPQHLVCGDFDGDHAVDVAVTRLGPNGVEILHNIGNGRFSARPLIALPQNVGQLSAVDVEGDGDLDLLVSVQQQFPSLRFELICLRNDGVGNFSAPTGYGVATAVHGAPHALHTADLTMDGLADAILTPQAAIFPQDSIWVLAVDSVGTFHRTQRIPIRAGASGLEEIGVTTGDFNRDGLPDLATCRTDPATVRDGATLTVYRNDRLIPFADSAQTILYATVGGQITTADLDGDGALEVCGSSAIGDFFAHRTTPGGGVNTFYWPVSSYQGHRLPPVIGDFDGDHYLEAFLDSANSSYGVMLRGFLFGSPQSFSTKAILFGQRTYALAAADVTGDGRLDLLAAVDDAVSVITNADLLGLSTIDAPASVNQPYPNPVATGGRLVVPQTAYGQPIELLDAMGRQWPLHVSTTSGQVVITAAPGLYVLRWGRQQTRLVVH